jgi:hypothetical protein
VFEFHPHLKKYFDEIFSEDSTQDDIFKLSVKPNIDKALTGYNFCLFAYGQTVLIF